PRHSGFEWSVVKPMLESAFVADLVEVKVPNPLSPTDAPVEEPARAFDRFDGPACHGPDTGLRRREEYHGNLQHRDGSRPWHIFEERPEEEARLRGRLEPVGAARGARQGGADPAPPPTSALFCSSGAAAPQARSGPAAAGTLSNDVTPDGAVAFVWPAVPPL